MGLIIFLVLVVIYIIIARYKHNYDEKIASLETSILVLKSELQSHIKSSNQPPAEKMTEPIKSENEVSAQLPVIPEPTPIPGPPVIESMDSSAYQELEPEMEDWEQDVAFDRPVFSEAASPDAESETKSSGRAEDVPAKSRRDTKDSGPGQRWEEFKANVDWELFTGVKLFAWLGGIALFIGAGFFVKYSIDKNLIPPEMRLAIGALTGLMLIIGATRFERARYEVLRHTLSAGGIGVLYSVAFAATLYYHYLSRPLGFGLLTVISAAAFVLAVYHRGIAISTLGRAGRLYYSISCYNRAG